MLDSNSKQRLLLAVSQNAAEAQIVEDLFLRSDWAVDRAFLENIDQLPDPGEYDLVVVSESVSGDWAVLKKDSPTVIICSPISQVNSCEVALNKNPSVKASLCVPESGCSLENVADFFPGIFNKYLDGVDFIRCCLLPTSFFTENRVEFPCLALFEKSELIDQELRLKLELVFQEAVTNAVEHGNLGLESGWKEEVVEDGRDMFSYVKKQRSLDPRFAERGLALAFVFYEDRIEIIIRDAGKGFRPFSKEGAELEESELPDCHGRGLTMIYNHVDEVKFNNKGTEITMVKRLSI